MKHLYRLVAIIVFLALMPIGSVFATAGGIHNSTIFYCDAVVVNFATYYSSELRVYDGPDPATDTLLGSLTTIGDFGLTAYTDIIILNKTVAEGTMLYLFLFTTGGFNETIYFSGAGAKSGNCAGLLYPPDDETGTTTRVRPTPPAYRQFGGEGARASVFLVDEENGSGNPILAIFDINEESQGTLLFYISITTLNEMYPADGGETILIYSNPDEFLEFYRLDTGELQINLGPDAEGKMHIISFNWDGSLPTDVVYETYFVFSFMIPRYVKQINSFMLSAQ